MYSKFRVAANYIHYYITASSGKGHGIHSPFVFEFITKILNDDRHFYAYDKIESCRNRLIVNDSLLEVEDFGAGSVTGNKSSRRISAITKNAAKSKKLGQLLFRVVNYYQPVVMIELGTSLGLSAAYLAMGNPSAKLVTCEGAASLLAAAIENFSSLEITNIETCQGNFNDTLPVILQRTANIDLAFIDGNHRKAATLQYFEQLLQKTGRPGILIFDDIHWSMEMEAAWLLIKQHPDTLLTIDLFFVGIVFFNDDFKVKQHFKIRF